MVWGTPPAIFFFLLHVLVESVAYEEAGRTTGREERGEKDGRGETVKKLSRIHEIGKEWRDRKSELASW